MNRPSLNLLLTLIAVLILSACGRRATPIPPTPDFSQNQRPEPKQTSTSILELTSTPTQAVGPVLTEPAVQLPLTEADVPRVSVQDAQAALDRGEAIIVDVRGDDAYRISHVAGAISIELGEFETNPAGIELDKNQWIITYCT